MLPYPDRATAVLMAILFCIDTQRNDGGEEIAVKLAALSFFTVSGLWSVHGRA